MIRIGIADDHQLVREGLRQIVEAQPDMEVVLEVPGGDELLGGVPEADLDVLCLDISMPGLGFQRVMERLAGDHPGLPILVVSMYPERGWAVQALKAGASGYLPKTSSSEELVEAIRRVHSGGRYITPAVADSLVGILFPGRGSRTPDSLSPREFEVLRKLGSGKMAKTVAWEMGISPKTVSAYRIRVLKKLGLKTNADLVRYASEHDLLD